MLIVLLGIFFISRIQPIFMIRILILIVLAYSYLIYFVLGGYWFGYALIIVMLRGILVVFTYIVSLIPNDRFEEYNLLYIFRLIIFTIGGSYIFIYYNKFRRISLILWGSFFRNFNIFIVRFLLLIILLTVWLRYFGYGALRIL